MKKTFLFISFLSALTAQADELSAKDPQLQAIYDHQKTLINSEQLNNEQKKALLLALLKVCIERKGNYMNETEEAICKKVQVQLIHLAKTALEDAINQVK